MTPEGRVLDDINNYASNPDVIDAMTKVLNEYPMFSKASPEEQALSSAIDRALLKIDLLDYAAARVILRSLESDRARYLLGHLERLSGDHNSAEAEFALITDPMLVDDVTMERCYRSWDAGEFAELLAQLEAIDEKSNRITEARYYTGLALFHLGNKDGALGVWRALAEKHAPDRWIYRADWAYVNTLDSNPATVATASSTSGSVLGRLGYLGPLNPDLQGRGWAQPR